MYIYVHISYTQAQIHTGLFKTKQNNSPLFSLASQLTAQALCSVLRTALTERH